MNELDEIIYSSRLLVVIDQLLDCKKIYIWGAGKMGNYIYDSLVLSGMEDRFSGFVTTSSPEFIVGADFLKRKFDEKTALVVATDYYRDVFKEVSAHLPVDENLVIWDGSHYFLDSHYLLDQEVKSFIIHLKKMKFDFSVSVDVGGNIGKYTSLLGFLGREVHSFEPNPDTYEVLRLRTNYMKNKVFLNVAGIGKESGVLTFYKDIFTKESTSSTFDKSIADNWSSNQFEEVELPVTTLDQYCSEKSISPTLIKIDAEGLDFDVIFGAEKVIKKSESIVIFENSLPYSNDIETAYDEFSQKFQEDFFLLNLSDNSIVSNWEILKEKSSVENKVPSNFSMIPLVFRHMFSG